MSYDELVEASMSLLSNSESESDEDSLQDSKSGAAESQVGRAAAAFAASAAAGSGAAAAAEAAAAAAAMHTPPRPAPRLGSTPTQGLAGSPSRGPPLLLQHDLKLQSSYKSVLGELSLAAITS